MHVLIQQLSLSPCLHLIKLVAPPSVAVIGAHTQLIP